MSKLNNVKELMIASKDLLVNVGWTKGNYVEYERGTAKVIGYCLLGSLSTACLNSDPDLYNIATTLIESRIQEKTGQDNIPRFNDAATTKKEDVISLLDEMIGEQP